LRGDCSTRSRAAMFRGGGARGSGRPEAPTPPALAARPSGTRRSARSAELVIASLRGQPPGDRPRAADLSSTRWSCSSRTTWASTEVARCCAPAKKTANVDHLGRLELLDHDDRVSPRRRSSSGGRRRRGSRITIEVERPLVRAAHFQRHQGRARLMRRASRSPASASRAMPLRRCFRRHGDVQDVDSSCTNQ